MDKPAKRTCEYGECDKPYCAKGLCKFHYNRMRKGEDLSAPKFFIYETPNGLCRIDYCNNPVKTRGYCPLHYSRHIRGTKMDGPPRRVYRRPDGSLRLEKSGYMEIKHNGAWILQHRHFMEQHIGRSLLPSETVHHRNGDRADNRMENLELWSSRHPRGQRVKDKLRWAREIISLYGAPSADTSWVSGFLSL